MTRQRARRAITPTTRFHRLGLKGPGLQGFLILGLLSLLLASAWLSQRQQMLQRETTRLSRELSWERDRLHAARADWFRGTTREAIVSRAALELSLREPGFDAKEVVVLEHLLQERPDGSDRLLAFARRLQRVGEVPTASARVNRP